MRTASGAGPKVMVAMGGPSSEREVSLSSGRECAAALREAGYAVIETDAGPDFAHRIVAEKPDVIFNALHGRWGEDGCVQGLFEWLKVPYTHSGVLASALTMDKELSKKVYREHGLPVVESFLAAKDAAATTHAMEPPYVIKPNNEGSSVGVYLVHEGANRPPELGPEMPETVMIEAFVPGRELTTTVMGDRPLTVTDILTDTWYDYAAKYDEGGSQHILPAEIPGEVFDACLTYALKAHDALGCRGLSRTDFRWDEAQGLDGLILLETNTQPGMTPTSLAPEQAAHLGISFPELCAWMVEDASCDR